MSHEGPPARVRHKPTPAEENIKAEIALLERLEGRIQQGDNDPLVKHMADLTRQILALMNERIRVNLEFRKHG